MDKIDLGRAFKAPFADTDWVKKTLLGWLWMLLGVTSPAVYGAQLEYIKSVSEGREDLPDWSDFGTKWVKGFLLLVAGFIYFLPVIVLGFIFAIPVVIAARLGQQRARGTGGRRHVPLLALRHRLLHRRGDRVLRRNRQLRDQGRVRCVLPVLRDPRPRA